MTGEFNPSIFNSDVFNTLNSGGGDTGHASGTPHTEFILPKTLMKSTIQVNPLFKSSKTFSDILKNSKLMKKIK